MPRLSSDSVRSSFGSCPRTARFGIPLSLSLVLLALCSSPNDSPESPECTELSDSDSCPSLSIKDLQTISSLAVFPLCPTVFHGTLLILGCCGTVTSTGLLVVSASLYERCLISLGSESVTLPNVFSTRGMIVIF